MIPSARSFAATPSGRIPSHESAWFSACAAAGTAWPARARLPIVPIPNASAPKAPWVQVWLSPQTIVMPGWVSPSPGPMTCTMPCSADSMSNSVMPNSSQLLLQRLQSGAAAMGSLIGPRAGGGHVVIDGTDGQVGPPHLAMGGAQAIERLRRRDFVDQVQIHIQQGRAARREHTTCSPQTFSNRVALFSHESRSCPNRYFINKEPAWGSRPRLSGGVKLRYRGSRRILCASFARLDSRGAAVPTRALSTEAHSDGGQCS